MQIKMALQQAIAALSQSESAELDAQILLAHVLKVERAYLFTWPEKNISEDAQTQFSNLIAKRKQHIPIAYLIGHKSFWTLDLMVNEHTLIPRPETEILVTEVLALPIDPQSAICADLGTGTGAIALALASERPAWQIYATDYSEKALACALKNAQRLQLERVTFRAGSWCAALPKLAFDIIVSNPPYISAQEWQLVAKDLLHEPKTALWSAEDGFADLLMIATSAREYLKVGGYLCLEHGFLQAERLQSALQQLGYVEIRSICDLAGLNRVMIARYLTV